MPLSEFEIIERYFRRHAGARDDVVLGIGDDAALVRPPPGLELALAIDTLVSGVHFLPSTDPAALGHKALAVNLSDLAAMGAEPAWATLSLTLPAADEEWLEPFAAGFAALARNHGVALIGGDTTRGPLSITVQVAGLIPPGQALRRSGAQPDDLIWVTGTLGDAALALRCLEGTAKVARARLGPLLQRLERPLPRVREGQALRGVASAAIDVSDGLAADLGHLLAAERHGATLHAARLPLSAPVQEQVAATGDWMLALAGGDDYELCFTTDARHRAEVESRFTALGTPCACIGQVRAHPGLRVVLEGGEVLDPAGAGYRHFGGR